MSNALATTDQRAQSVIAEVSQAINASRKTLLALLPKEITPERLKALTMTSIRKTPALMKCDARSILACVYEAAKLGLQPDTATADCHIIPRGKQATFQIGYKGMMKLARRAVPGVPIKAEHVCENDSFVWEEGLAPILKHSRAPAGERGKVVYAYAIAQLPGGLIAFKVVDADDIARARKTAFSTAWQHHEGAMWEKTAIKRLAKTLPIDDPAAAERLHRAIALDDAADDGRPQELGDDLLSDVEDDDPTDADFSERYACPAACGATEDTVASHAQDCPEAPK